MLNGKLASSLQNQFDFSLDTEPQIALRPIWDVLFLETPAPDKRAFVVASGRELISCEWNRDIIRVIQRFGGDVHHKTIRRVDQRTDAYGLLLAAVGFDGLISLWRQVMEDFVHIETIECSDQELKSVSLRSSELNHDMLLAAAGRDKKIWVFSSPPNEWGCGHICSAVLSHHTQDVKLVRFVPDTENLLSCSYDCTMLCWEFDGCDLEWQVKYQFPGSSTVWYGCQLSQQPCEWISADADANMTWWKCHNSLSLNIVLASHSTGIFRSNTQSKHDHITKKSWNVADSAILSGCIIVTEKNRLLAFGCEGGSIKLFTLNAGYNTVPQLLENWQAHHGDVNCLSYNAMTNTLLSGGDDGSVRFWNLEKFA